MTKPTQNNNGVISLPIPVNIAMSKNALKQSIYPLGKKYYETTDWLGNVRVTYTDKKSWQQNKFALNVSSSLDYYPFGSVMEGRNLEIFNYRFGFNGWEKDDEVKGEGNHISFGDYGYDTRLGRRLRPEPLNGKYPFLSSYSVINNNPIIYRDVNGLDWEITSITFDNKGNKTVHIKLTAAVINNSSNTTLDMVTFATKSAEQISKTFSVKYSRATKFETINLNENLDRAPNNLMYPTQINDVTIIVDVDIRVINSESELKENEHLISVENDNDPKMTPNETAHVNEIGGKKIFVKESVARDVISGRNKRTIAHEAGHTLGLYHITQKYASDLDKIFGKELPTYTKDKDILKTNLMGPFFNNSATKLTDQQAEIIEKNISNGKVNK